ncbi:MAG: hypothetical protein ACYS6K_05240 [Planctomycetota bacterium]|jgi:hypothetical protein
MFKKQKKQVFVFGMVAILSISLATPVAEAAVDIDWLALTTFKDYDDGIPLPNPWGIDIWVYATNPGNLNYIEVTKPGGIAPFVTMYETGDSGFWDYGSPEYSSLPDLRAVFPLGIYIFDFYDSGSILIDSVSLNYSITEWPDMPVDFTNPSVNGQIISANPTLTWTVDPDAGDALMRALEDSITEETFLWDAPLSMTTTSWAPGPLSAGRQHELDVSVLEVQDWVGPDWPTKTTSGGDLFAYSLMTEYFNEIHFLTMPAVGTLSGWIYMPPGVPDIGYSLDEGDLLYFFSSEPVWNLNLNTGEWDTVGPEGLVYANWPFIYELDSGHLWFAYPPASGLWVYHFSTGQWEILPQTVP